MTWFDVLTGFPERSGDVGGGVFGNKLDWILSAIGRSLGIFASAELDVYIVSYGASKTEVANFVAV